MAARLLEGGKGREPRQEREPGGRKERDGQKRGERKGETWGEKEGEETSSW